MLADVVLQEVKQLPHFIHQKSEWKDMKGKF